MWNTPDDTTTEHMTEGTTTDLTTTRHTTHIDIAQTVLTLGCVDRQYIKHTPAIKHMINETSN